MAEALEPTGGPDRRAPEARSHTFLFADLAGYTALTEAHGDERAADVAAEFCANVRPLLPDYDAEEVKAIGDALLVRVPDPAAAAQLAERVVRGFGRRHHALGIRIAMHTGSAVRREGDWFGSGVNLAARVADVARPGEVLLTQATRDALGDAVAVRPRGSRAFKHVPLPIALYALALGTEHAPPLEVDPVCRMTVDPELAQAREVRQGREYLFCSARCHEVFQADPVRYVRERSSRDDLRVSDQAREVAADHLRHAFARGRLTDDELESRLERTLAAQTRGELAAVSHDLPRRRRRRRTPFRMLSRWLTWPARRLRRFRRTRAAHRSARTSLRPPR